MPGKTKSWTERIWLSHQILKNLFVSPYNYIPYCNKPINLLKEEKINEMLRTNTSYFLQKNLQRQATRLIKYHANYLITTDDTHTRS